MKLISNAVSLRKTQKDEASMPLDHEESSKEGSTTTKLASIAATIKEKQDEQKEPPKVALENEFNPLRNIQSTLGSGTYVET